MTYEVKLDIFEGPLDLLLFLIRKNEIDIYDIPIALITGQYLLYLDMMRSLNLDLAGEYLVLAATLLHIKSRLLLPADETPPEAEDETDPRQELVRQLLEYKAYKEAALDLDKRPLLERDVFKRAYPLAAPSSPEEEDDAMIEVSLFELVEVFHRMISRLDDRAQMEIDTERLSLADMISEIMDRLQETRQLTFEELLDGARSRRQILYTFLAVLELMKQRMVRAYQAGPFGAIRIFLAVEA